MAVSPASDKRAAGSAEKGATSAAGDGSHSTTTCSLKPGVTKSASMSWPDPASRAQMVRATVLALMAVVALAVPILLLVRFEGHPMSQVWSMSLVICSYIFAFLMRITRSRWTIGPATATYLARLSYAPLLAFFSATAIGSVTATFVLFFSTVWAAGNLGYALAVHRLRKGTEPAIHALRKGIEPATKDTIEDLNFNLHIGVPIVVLLWTLVMALAVYVLILAGTDELLILTFLSFFGWVHAALWVVFVTLVPMHGVLIGEWMEWLLPALVPWMILSPLLCLVSKFLSVLCHLLLMVALVAYLWYNFAVYKHYLQTATPRTTQENEDTLQSEIQQDNIGLVKSDATLGEPPSETAATLVDPLQNPIDEEAVIMAVQGKKHGSYLLLDRHSDPATSLSQIRASSTSESSDVQPHGQCATVMITDLQAQLEEERRQRLEEREDFERRLQEERIQRQEAQEKQQADMREHFRAMYAKVFGHDLPSM